MIPKKILAAIFVAVTIAGCDRFSPSESWPPSDIPVTRWSDGMNNWRDVYTFRQLDSRRFDLGEISGPMRLRLGYLPLKIDDLQSEIRILVGGEVIETLTYKPGYRWIDRSIEIPAPEKGTERVIVEIDNGGLPRMLVSDLELYAPRSAGRPPNVLTIVIDTLRADHLGSYGYDRDTSPNIDKLVAESVKFEHMVSQAPWTAPSVASLFSGYQPATHGAVSWRPVYLDGLPSIAEALARNGYVTRCVSLNAFTLPRLGFDKGFQRFNAMRNRKLGEVEARAVDASIEQISGVLGRPWYAHLHVLGPHSPYDPEEPYWTRFLTADDSIDRESLNRMMNDSNNTGMGWLFKKVCAWKKTARLPVEGDTRPDITSFLSELELKELAIALYDAEISYTDAQIGRLMDFLKETGEYENTLILLISDHGEELWDHGEVHHGHTLYNELTSVPFILKPPGGSFEAKSIDDVVELVDLAPTIADYTEIDLDWIPEGQSLRPVVEGRSIAPRIARSSLSVYTYLAEESTDLAKLYLRSVQDRSRKIIFDENSGQLHFYDLVADPQERHPFYEAPDDFSLLLQALEGMSRMDTQGLNILFCAPRDRAVSLKGTVQIADSGEAAFQSTAVQGQISRTATGWEFEIEVNPSEEHHPQSPRFNPVFYIPCPSDQMVSVTLLLDGEPIEPENLQIHRQGSETAPEALPFPLDRHVGRIREYVGAAVHDRPSVYVWYGRDSMTAGDGSLDSEFDDELEALGYL